MTSTHWRQAFNALAYDNVGSVGELRRRLESDRQVSASSQVEANGALKAFAALWRRITGWWHARSALRRQWDECGARFAARWRGRRTIHNAALADDIFAGITVALVAIPQSLACAQLAGVPAYYGLYASILPTIIGALFGSSPQLSTGPTAMTSLLTAASVAPLAGADSQTFIADVILLALISGAFQLLFGLLRMGALLNFLSHPVLMGFVNAAALIIGLSQLPALLGMPSQQSEHFLADIWNLLQNLPNASGIAMTFGLTAIAMMALFRRIAPRFPGVLVTIIVLTAASSIWGYAEKGGAVVGDIPTGMPPLAWPAAKWETVVTLLPAGFVISLISFMEAMSSAKLSASRTRQRWDQNRELVGQGLAKVAAAFSQSMPVSGSFSRSAVNAGARTYLSSVITAIAILVTLLFFASLLYHTPKSALAAIVMLSVIGLIDMHTFRRAWLANRDDGMAAAGTFAATLGFAPFIQNGIIAGALMSLGLLLYRMMRPVIVVMGLPDRAKKRIRWDAAEETSMPASIDALRFDGSLHFVTSSYFEEALVDLQRDNARLRYILVQCGGINDLDATGVEVLRGLISRSRENDVTLAFSEIKPQVRAVMDRTGLTKQIGAENLFATDEHALLELKQRVGAPAPNVADTAHAAA